MVIGMRLSHSQVKPTHYQVRAQYERRFKHCWNRHVLVTGPCHRGLGSELGSSIVHDIDVPGHANDAPVRSVIVCRFVAAALTLISGSVTFD